MTSSPLTSVRETPGLGDQAYTQFLADLLRFDTTNPPGNELAAAQFIKRFLDQEGIECQILESTPGRGNVLARLRGNGSAPPLLLLSHLDVVPAKAEEWTFPPFGGLVREGMLYGRGVLDNKALCTLQLFTLVALKRRSIPLRRDVVFLSVADEEGHGTWGLSWLLKNYEKELTAEYLLTEGGFAVIRDGLPIYTCQNAEKGLCWVRLTTHGVASHGSIPAREGAIAKMLQVLQKVRAWSEQFPFQPVPESLQFFQSLAKREKGFRRFVLHRLHQPFWFRRFAPKLAEDPIFRAILQDTIAVTRIQAGHKVNVLPAKCEAYLDCRRLPGLTTEAFLAELKHTLKGEAVEVTLLASSESNASRTDTLLFQTMQQVIAAKDPHAVVSPFMLPGGTDSRFFRERGVSAYGFFPIKIPYEDIRRIHGPDERLSLSHVEAGLDIYYETVKRIGARR